MSGKAVRDTLAALGVIASLVFVGVEIRQNTAAVRGATLQAMTDMQGELLLLLASDSGASRIRVMGDGDPSSLTELEASRISLATSSGLDQPGERVLPVRSRAGR